MHTTHALCQETEAPSCSRLDREVSRDHIVVCQAEPRYPWPVGLSSICPARLHLPRWVGRSSPACDAVGNSAARSPSPATPRAPDLLFCRGAYVAHRVERGGLRGGAWPLTIASLPSMATERTIGMTTSPRVAHYQVLPRLYERSAIRAAVWLSTPYLGRVRDNASRPPALRAPVGSAAGCATRRATHGAACCRSEAFAAVWLNPTWSLERHGGDEPASHRPKR
jgi:hypothetical protein